MADEIINNEVRVKVKHYEIWLNNVLVKSYPFKAQAVMWCFLNKFVNSRYGW